MRTALAVVLGIVALLALLLAVVAGISVLLGLLRRTPVKDALITTAVFVPVFLVASCSALVALPGSDPERSAAPENQEKAAPETTKPEATKPETTEQAAAKPKPEPEPDPKPPPEKEAFIPGLVAVDVYGNLEDRGFTCDGPNPTETMFLWTCESSDASADYVVEIYGESAGEIRSIEASLTGYGTVDFEPAAKDFLGFLATTPYGGSQPAEAQAWVEESISTGGNRRIGPAKYRLYGEGQARILEISSEQGLGGQ